MAKQGSKSQKINKIVRISSIVVVVLVVLFAGIIKFTSFYEYFLDYFNPVRSFFVLFGTFAFSLLLITYFFSGYLKKLSVNKVLLREVPTVILTFLLSVVLFKMLNILGFANQLPLNLATYQIFYLVGIIVSSILSSLVLFVETHLDYKKEIYTNLIYSYLISVLFLLVVFFIKPFQAYVILIFVINALGLLSSFLVGKILNKSR